MHEARLSHLYSALRARPITAAEAAASAGIPNVDHSGAPLPNRLSSSAVVNVFGPAVGLIRLIPRSAQPPLTEAQQRIVLCSYAMSEANAEILYALFVPSRYDARRRWPLILALHGNGLTPLQQMLFDGLADHAERYGYIVAAPTGFHPNSSWGLLSGPVEVPSAARKAGTERRYTVPELAQLDALHVLRRMLDTFNVDHDRIYLMGYSVGGAAACRLGALHNDLWAGIASLAGSGADERYAPASALRMPLLVMHGTADPIVPVADVRRCVAHMRANGLQHLYLEFPGKEHEFWIRRGAKTLEKVFMFFDLVSRVTNVATSGRNETQHAAGEIPS